MTFSEKNRVECSMEHFYENSIVIMQFIIKIFVTCDVLSGKAWNYFFFSHYKERSGSKIGQEI
jgi:hypothetical protein